MAVRQMLVAGRYRLLEPVGAGGMGRVWLARDQMLDRDVAIKEIVPPDWMSEAEKDRLHSRTLREARSAARLTHPHVVRVYDVMHAGGLSWIVMEYVASRSLYQVLTTKGPYPPVEAARIGLAVLDALTAAHRAGVLHRDVKPHNVLIASDGRVLLTDFGLATFVDDGMITTPGLIVGSPQYVSPERARDGASTVEADLWSFGATLYATVEGRSPYARDSAMATLAALATEPPDPPVRAGPLGPVLVGLLRYDPQARLSAEEVDRLLRVVAEGVPAQRRRHPAGARSPAGAAPDSVDREAETRPVDSARGVAAVVVVDLDTPNLAVPDQAAKPGAGESAEPSGRADLVRTGDLAATDLFAAADHPSSDVEDAAAGLPGPAVAGGPPDLAAAVAGTAPSEAGSSDLVSAADSGSPEDADDSDGWWHPSGRRPGDTAHTTDDRADLARSGYIEGTFTSHDQFSQVPATAAARHGGGNYRGPGDNRAPTGPDPSSSRPNRQPLAAGEPATTPSLRRGNQTVVRAIPAPRSPVSGPLPSPRVPPRRWPPRSRPVSRGRTRVVVAGLLAVVVLGGSLLSLHLIGHDDSAPQVGHSTAPSPSVSSPAPRASPPEARASPEISASSWSAGFSPVVCDAGASAGAPVAQAAPKESDARGVSGWELQAGWSYFTDGTGFHMPVPDGWTYRRIGTTYCFQDPLGARVLTLDVGREAGIDPLQGCRAEDQRLRLTRRIRDYELIGIASVTLLHDAADWDYRYRTTAGALRRVTTRWVAIDGRSYALGWATPEAAWATELGKIQMVRGTFYTEGLPSTTARRG